MGVPGYREGGADPGYVPDGMGGGPVWCPRGGPGGVPGKLWGVRN